MSSKVNNSVETQKIPSLTQPNLGGSPRLRPRPPLQQPRAHPVSPVCLQRERGHRIPGRADHAVTPAPTRVARGHDQTRALGECAVRMCGLTGLRRSERVRLRVSVYEGARARVAGTRRGYVLRRAVHLFPLFEHGLVGVEGYL